MNLFGKPNLEKIIAKKNIKGLLKALEYKKDIEIRRKAAEALGQLGDISAVGPLRAAAGDEEAAVRMAAIEALGKFEEKPSVVTLLEAALHDKQDSVRRIAARIVARYPDQVIKDVISRMRGRLVRATSNEIEDKYVEAAVRVVAEVGKPAVNPLITVLREKMDCTNDYTKKAPIKAFAAKALGRIGDSRAITPLGARLKDISMPEWIRRYFVQALVEIDDPRAIKPLAAALKQTNYSLARPSVGLGGLTDPYVAGEVAANNRTRVLIVEALASFDDPEVIPILINRFKDKSEKVFDAAHQALIKIGTPAVEPLIEALSARSTKVRNYAAQTLGRIGDKRAVEHIIPLLEDRDEKVPQGAASALGWLGDELAVEPLIKALAGCRRDTNFYNINSQTEQKMTMVAKKAENSAFG